MTMQRPGQFKMVLLGESAVGKSSLALRFAKGQYQDHAESTIGAAFLTHTIQIDADTILKVELWDTAGQERYHSLAPMYYRGAQAALVVYDLTNTESLRRAKMWVRELRQVNANDMVIGLAGNKADLVAGNKRQIDIREVAEYAEENGLIHMETSAKRGDNVIEIFMSVAKQVAAKQLPSTLNKPKDAFPPTKSKESGSCCGGTATINKTNSLTTKKISSTTIIDQSTSTPDIDSDENDESDETLISSNIIDATSRIKNKLPLVLVTNANRNRITSTKSSLPIILGSIFGGLTGIVLIAGIITYLLIKQGYIKVFNQPRTRIVDSSSITVDANPSQR